MSHVHRLLSVLVLASLLALLVPVATSIRGSFSDVGPATTGADFPEYDYFGEVIVDSHLIVSPIASSLNFAFAQDDEAQKAQHLEQLKNRASQLE